MARLSPFHMARLFREQTGLPPASFLTAVRLEEARHRLLHTSDSVADIAVQCGYTSVGSFTTRFTKVVGVSPGRYRRLQSLGAEAVDFVGGQDAAVAYGSVLGSVERADGLDHEPVYVAAFAVGGSARACPPPRAARCRRVERGAGPWGIPHVPEGRWIVQAVSRSTGTGQRSIVIGTSRPLRLRCGEVARVTLRLEPPADIRHDDARLLLGFALPELFAS
ncbi:MULTISPECIES: helix-turn-helix transcriptional regulator [unclassified Streptomyces]|uniref:helix-turn-helix transcriptional regulator n=1 Tax=unclassified Streptomyces TaxID=2593676 RepID=UPI00278C8656|nr:MULTISPECIES: helix-turn-helix transcriptional regulator [unclassified Streptomyces]